MANELMTIQESTFSYDYVPATLEIKNLDNIKSTVKEISKHYKKTVFQEDDLSGINQAHLELNRFKNGLEESRKNVKNEYNKPLEEFENEIKGLVELLDDPLNDLKEQRDEILDAQEENRRNALNDYLERRLEDTNVRIEDLEIEKSWTNKGNWTDKLNPRKKLTDEVNRQIELIEEEQKKKLADREVLETFLDSKGMEHEGWTSQLEFREALDIIKEIQRTEERKKQEEERIKQEEERRKQIEAEQSHFEQEKEEPVFESGLFERDFEEVVPEVEPELITEKIEITATREQLDEIYRYLDVNRIGFKPVIDETLDDLPW